MSRIISILLLICSSFCFNTTFRIKSNIFRCDNSNKKKRLARVLIMAKTESDLIKGWSVFGSFVVPCSQIDTFMVEVDTIENGGIVNIDGQENSFPGKGAVMGPISARVFVESQTENKSSVDNGSIDQIVISNQNNLVRISYKYVNPKMLKLLESFKEPYVHGKTIYNVTT